MSQLSKFESLKCAKPAIAGLPKKKFGQIRVDSKAVLPFHFTVSACMSWLSRMSFAVERVSTKVTFFSVAS